MNYCFFGDDLALSSALLRDLNDGKIEQIVISPAGRYNAIAVQIIRAEKNKESGFEYVDEDDL